MMFFRLPQTTTLLFFVPLLFAIDTVAQPLERTIPQEGLAPFGGTLYPMENVDVRVVTLRIVAEQIRPALGPFVHSWAITTTYQMLSESDDSLQVRLAMVERCLGGGTRNGDNPTLRTGDRCIQSSIDDETLLLDGRSVSGRIGLSEPDDRGVLRNLEYTRLRSFVVPFKPRQLRTLDHRYTLHSATTPPDVTELLLLLRTAALFSGPVGEMEVVVSVWDHFDEVTWVSPSGSVEKQSKDDLTTWTLKLPSGDPAEDVIVRFRAPLGVERARAIDSYCNAPDDVVKQKTRAEIRSAKTILFAAYGAVPIGETQEQLSALYPWFKRDDRYESAWISKDHLQCLARLKRFERMATR